MLLPVAVTFQRLVHSSSWISERFKPFWVLSSVIPLQALKRPWISNVTRGLLWGDGNVGVRVNWRPFSESSRCILQENGTKSSLLGMRDLSWGAIRLGLSKKKKKNLNSFVRFFKRITVMLTSISVINKLSTFLLQSQKSITDHRIVINVSLGLKR